MSQAAHGKVANVADGELGVPRGVQAGSSACSTRDASPRRRWPRCRRSSSISRDVDPTIQQDMRYAGSNNFTGGPVPGYDAPECVLVRQAAEALKRVKPMCKAKGFALKVYDCYRPARAVAAFVALGEGAGRPEGQGDLVPQPAQSPTLFPDYIATRSGHSRGATLDLTLVPLERRARLRRSNGGQAARLHRAAGGHAPDGSLAMGTSFDCFDVKANTAA